MNFKVHIFKKVSSTNDEAIDLAKKGVEEGNVVVADSQTAGRGRMKRKWYSKSGNLYLSLILRPQIKTADASHITFVAALAASSTLEKNVGTVPQLKWPNDVLIERKKIAGILTEFESEGDNIDFMVVGVGMNVNQEVFPKSIEAIATSLCKVSGKKCDLKQVREDFLSAFDQWYTDYLEKGFSFIKEIWEERSLIKGRAVEVKDNRKRIRGVALGLDTRGALLVQTPKGETLSVYTGDLVSF